MKKYLLSLMAVLTFGTAIVSCSDKDTDPVTPENPDTPVNPEKKDSADYTVIFWGMAGENDISTSVDLATLAYNYQQGLIGKNVNIAGLMKTTLGKTNSPYVDSSYDKTMYFDSDSIGTNAIPKEDTEFSTVQSIETSEKSAATKKLQSLYEEAFNAMGGKVYGDSLYPLNNTDSLANFIQAAAKKFPARHYVLMFFGHGDGFSPVTDTPVSTKGCVVDGYRGNAEISAAGVVSAVQKSGVKMQTIFTQCCQMAALENIAAYSQVFDYGILSAENTNGYYFPEYLVKLSQAGDDEAKLQEKSCELVDYYVSRAAKYDEVFGDESYTSHGFYDLRKAEPLIAATKEATDWFVANYADNKDAIERALASSVASITLGMDGAPFKHFNDSVRKVRKEIQDVIAGKVSFQDETEFVKFVTKTVIQVSAFASFPYSFDMADVMKNAMQANLSEEKTAAMKAIYDKYMTALKDMAYINCTEKPSNASADYPYLYASPTINIVSMHPDYFIPLLTTEHEILALSQELYKALMAKDEEKVEKLGHTMLEGTVYANLSDLDTVKRNYTSSVFDQKVGWSRFLEQLQITPSIGYCPDRWQVNQEMK